jgi:methionyl-tRNA synthetase
MSARRFYITTTIPYVNGDPHLGHALEFVQADVLARHRRLRGDEVRFLSGTDDNALKNVLAAEAEGLPVAEFVNRNAARLADLREPLQLTYDDFIRTSVDERHRVGVQRLWRSCARAGDLYQHDYSGLYCTGCEAFLAAAELERGLCPEHETPPEEVVERNWFFRLSRYQDEVLTAIESGRLRIEPEHGRNEVVAFIRSGLSDFSVSRIRERARGWGIPVPDDPSQVIYVWFDALGNYITALRFAEGGGLYHQWWKGSDERVHVIGKGVLRFHAVYWPAILLSAREPLPTTILVHDYLTENGRKLGKSLGNLVAPTTLIERYGADAVRWWLVRDVRRVGDTDFRDELLVARTNSELANELGNLVNRTVSLARKYRPDGLRADGSSAPSGADAVLAALDELGSKIDAGLAHFDFRAATDAVWRVVTECNRFISAVRPWELAKAERAGAEAAGGELQRVLHVLFRACETIGLELEPFLPSGSRRILAVLRGQNVPLFPKLGVDGSITQAARSRSGA